MAFSFNWAGLTAPQVSMGKEVDLNEIGKNLGSGLRGYRNREASEEFAKKIDEYRNIRGGNLQRANEIRARIAELEEENKQLATLVTPNEVGEPVEQSPNLPPMDPKDYELLMFDPTTASKEDTKKVQGYLWGDNTSEIDGNWGPKSQAKWDEWYNNQRYFQFGG
jgi:hypothetical protein